MLDARELRRVGRRAMGFRDTGHLHGVSRWTLQCSGAEVAWVEWEAGLHRGATAHLMLRGSVGGVPLLERVALRAAAPRYGGVRWWYACPACDRRCGRLYLPPGARRFACRLCMGLAYQSQREAAPYRLQRRAHALWRRVGADVGVAPRTPVRPKGMRQATYRRLVAQARELDLQALLGMLGGMPAR